MWPNTLSCLSNIGACSTPYLTSLWKLLYSVIPLHTSDWRRVGGGYPGQTHISIEPYVFPILIFYICILIRLYFMAFIYRYICICYICILLHLYFVTFVFCHFVFVCLYLDFYFFIFVFCFVFAKPGPSWQIQLIWTQLQLISCDQIWH